MQIINHGVILGLRGFMYPGVNIPEIFIGGSQQLLFSTFHTAIDPGKGDEEEQDQDKENEYLNENTVSREDEPRE